MEDRVYLVGCILKGMAARGEIYFGMAEDALDIADAALEQIKAGSMPIETAGQMKKEE